MNGKVEFTLKPLTGSASGQNCFRAEVATGKGEVVGLDDVIAEAIDRGFVSGIKPAVVKNVIQGVLTSMIQRVMEDGRPRRIDDFFTLSLKVHGLFADKTEEFDPSKHTLALSLKQLNAYRPSFDSIVATNINHKRQFRLYSVRSVMDDGREDEKNPLEPGREFVVNGSDLKPDAGTLSVSLNVFMTGNSTVGGNAPILSATESKIRCAWPDNLSGDEYRNKRCIVSVFKIPDSRDPSAIVSRETRAFIGG